MTILKLNDSIYIDPSQIEYVNIKLGKKDCNTLLGDTPIFTESRPYLTICLKSGKSFTIYDYFSVELEILKPFIEKNSEREIK